MNWMFTDMDSYFASVEQYLRPELRGRPVGIIPLETDSTCVIAASYDAKRLGVKVGTGVREARELCPGIVLVKARPDLYVRIHHQILQSVDHAAEVCKVYSIDEWSVRLRGDCRQPARAQQIAQDVKEQILKDFGPWLTCSIGIAPTRLLAKIASDLQKPNGLTLLPIDDMPDRLEHLKLDDLCGISHGMLARFDRNGVRDIRDLWNLTRDQAVRIWGSVSGAHWWDGFHGRDEPEVPTRRRSMTHGSVLEPRFRNAAGARGILIRLVCKLGHRLRQQGYLAQSMRIALSEERGRDFSADIALPAVNDTPTLVCRFDQLWEQRPENFVRFKQVNVTIAGLVLASQVPRSLFDQTARQQRLSQTMDKINARHGQAAIYLAPIHDYRHPMDNKIAFGRIPDEIE